MGSTLKREMGITIPERINSEIMISNIVRLMSFK